MAEAITFDPAPAAAAPPAPPAPAPLTTPTPASAPEKTARPTAETVEEPPGSLAAVLVTGGPAVAVIAGCWLLWKFGPVILIGALVMAAIAAIAAVKTWAQHRRGGRAASRTAGRTPPLGSPARHTMSSSAPASASAGRPGSRLASAARRGAAAVAGTPGGNTAAGRRSARAQRAAAAGARTSAGPSRTAGGPAASTVRRGQAAARAARAAGSSVYTGRPSSQPGGKTTGKPSTAAATPRKAGSAAGTTRRGLPGAGKSSPQGTAAGARPGRVAGRGVTSTGRTRVSVPAGTGSRTGVTKRIPGARRPGSAGAAAKAAVRRTPGLDRVKRQQARAAMRRRVATVRAGRRNAVAGVRRGARAAHTMAAPLAARAWLGFGKALRRAHSHADRWASAAAGPTWMHRFARGLAYSLQGTLAAGAWVTRRKHVQAWLLRHYAATGLSTPAVVLTKAAATVAPAAVRHVLTPKPGPAIRILTPTGPASSGASAMTSHIDVIIDAHRQHVALYEPDSVTSLTSHIESFSDMFEAFAADHAALASRLQDDYGVKPGVVDMIQQLGAALAGMTDLCQDVVQSWRIEQAEDLARHETPRPNEEGFWNVQPGGGA